jgi:hypothetical protein
MSYDDPFDDRIEFRCFKADKQLIRDLAALLGEGTSMSTLERELMLKGARDMMEELKKIKGDKSEQVNS